MEFNVFRDYCKAENSDDEEAIHDIQSRLYSQIYYAPNDTKVDVKSVTNVADNDNLRKEGVNNETPGPSNASVKNNSSKNSKEMCSSFNLGDSESNGNESKPDVNSINLESTTERLSMKVDNKSKLNTCSVSDKNSELSRHNTVCCNTDNKNSKCDTSVTEDTHVKTEKESNSEDKLSEHEHANQSPPMCIVNENLQDSDNILNKYKFSKSFINNLCQEKYHNIKKKLQEIAENKEKAKTKLNEAKQEESDKYRKNDDQKDLSRCKKSFSGMKEPTKYATLNKTQKAPIQEILLTDSDSEESILEVPIPPKPQPPVIQLQDSDDQDSDTSTDVDLDYSFIRTNKTCMQNLRETDAQSENKEDSTTTVVNNKSDVSNLGDIMLNCTEIQKGATSVKEIMEMSKSVQSEQAKVSNESREHNNEYEIEDSSESSHLLKANNDNEAEFQLASEDVDNSNVVYERDKIESNNFAEDEMVSNFNDTENLENMEMEVTEVNSRKRSSENVNEPSTSTVKETECTETKRFKTSSEIENNDENYFFRPMSDKLKAFYNESKGQENFDVKEIQSKMSKDPRLWAILDEDLMPDLFKTKVGNKKCTNCNQFGHMKHNCPEPERLILCYICGKEGHRETRCPQKMCLTCGKKQNIFRKTCETCSKLYCTTCKAVGHISSKCPDLWRRFHQTTTLSEVNVPKNLSQVMKPANLLYCCNCTKRGHDSSMCKEYRWSQHFPTPAFVSNYNGPNGASSKKGSNPDVIPLKKQKKHLIFSDDDLEGCRVVYAFGTFRTCKANGEERIRKLCNTSLVPSDTQNFMQGKVTPIILAQLHTLLEFDVRVYYDLNNEPTIRIRSFVGCTNPILQAFLFWLQLHDKAKTLSFIIDIPRCSNDLVPFISSKLNELTIDLRNPHHVWNEIKETEKLLSEADNTTTRVKALSAKLANAQLQFLKVFLTKPSVAKPVTYLRRFVKKHTRKGCKLSLREVSIGVYLQIVVKYNQIFLPRSLKETEVRRFLTAYKRSERRKQQNECNETKAKPKNETNTGCKKSQNQKKSAYELFIEKLQASNKARQAENKNKDGVSKKVEQQKKSSNVTIPVEKISKFTQSNNEAVVNNVRGNITETTNVHHVDSIQNSHDEKTANDDKVMSSVSIDIISSDDSNAKQSKVARVVETHSVQEQSDTIDSTPTSAKKKKTKKTKKGNGPETTDSPIATVDSSLRGKADELIAEALKYELPYMNKAVEEIRKRINEKSLKQEHIDTLQRLVNMENDHRKYISTFCNYL